jgi:hypothetical protein
MIISIKYDDDDNNSNKDNHSNNYKIDKFVIQHIFVSFLGPSDHKLKWDGTSDLAIDLNDTRIKHHVDHGLIEIKKSGLYQIYSQIVLEHEMNDRDQHGSASIYQHSVILKQAGMPDDYNREKFILKVSNTHCASVSDTHTITSYISGAFQLTEGDKLGVRVHNNSEIAAVPHMNFFGVHML